MLKWVRWESRKRYHAVYVEAMGVYWTYGGLSQRPALESRTKPKSRQSAAVAASEFEALNWYQISYERCGKVRKPSSLMAGRSELRKLDQILGICDIRDAVRLSAFKALP